MTELTFLLDLLLNHKLPVATRVAVTERIRQVEASLLMAPAPARPMPVPPHLANQSPSTVAALQRHPDLIAELAKAQPVVSPVAVIAHTPEAQAAMSARQQAIDLAITGKPEKGRTSPRKF